jgi:hypothetical protein
MAKPQKCISVQTAKEMYSNWQTTRGAALESDGYQDISDFTFTLEEMQEFLDYVRVESEKAKIDNPGIRIYFAAYDPATNDKATVFLSATKGTKSNSENNYNIDPFNWGQGGWPPNNY